MFYAFRTIIRNINLLYSLQRIFINWGVQKIAHQTRQSVVEIYEVS